MLGFPVLRRLADVRGSAKSVCSFAKTETTDWHHIRSRDRESRDRNVMISQAGNSIAVVVSGYVELFCMLFAEVTDRDSFAR